MLNDAQALAATLRAVSALPHKPRLLLQACCGPCSTTVLEQLTPSFDITVLYYNPNTWPEAEFLKRLDALQTTVSVHSLPILTPEYRHVEFLGAARGLEAEPEGGGRCEKCWLLRLRYTAQYAAEHGYEWFGSTLTVGPTKDAKRINPMGEALEKEYGIRYLRANFKKAGGYLRSLELSRELGLYRQNYCGCEFSIRK